EQPGGPVGADHLERLIGESVLEPVQILRADQRRFRPADVTPALETDEPTSVSPHVTKETVGREEEQVSAEIAVASDRRVFACRHVLLVPWEDDEVVEVGEALPARPGIEIRVREEVRRAGNSVEPL